MRDEAKGGRVTEDCASRNNDSEDRNSDSDAGIDDPRAMRRRNAVAAVAVAILLIANGAMGWEWKRARDVDTDMREAHAAAQAVAEALININPANIEAGFQRTMELSTGDFKDAYTTSSQELREALVEHQATAHGTIVESAATTLSDDSVEVLLFVDQSVSNAMLAEPRLDRSRIRMTMQKVDDRWLAGRVEVP